MFLESTEPAPQPGVTHVDENAFFLRTGPLSLSKADQLVQAADDELSPQNLTAISDDERMAAQLAGAFMGIAEDVLPDAKTIKLIAVDDAGAMPKGHFMVGARERQARQQALDSVGLHEVGAIRFTPDGPVRTVFAQVVEQKAQRRRARQRAVNLAMEDAVADFVETDDAAPNVAFIFVGKISSLPVRFNRWFDAALLAKIPDHWVHVGRLRRNVGKDARTAISAGRYLVEVAPLVGVAAACAAFGAHPDSGHPGIVTIGPDHPTPVLTPGPVLTPDTPTAVVRTPTATPTEVVTFLPIPTSEPKGGDVAVPTVDAASQQAQYREARLELSGAFGFKDANVTSQAIDGSGRAIGLATFTPESKVPNRYFVMDKTGRIQWLGDAYNALVWKFTPDGIVLLDPNGTQFGKVKADGTPSVDDFAMTAGGGIRFIDTSLPVGQQQQSIAGELPVKVSNVQVDEKGNILAAQIANGFNKDGTIHWVTLDKTSLAQLTLSAQARLDAKVVIATATPPPPEVPKPVILHTYGGDFDFSKIPPTYPNALAIEPELVNLKEGSGVLNYYEIVLHSGKTSYDIFTTPNFTQIPNAELFKHTAFFIKVKSVEPNVQMNGQYSVFRVRFDWVKPSGEMVDASVLLQTSQSVMSNFPHLRKWCYFAVPDETISPAMIRPGDEIAYSAPGYDGFPQEIADSFNKAQPGKPAEQGLFGLPNAQILLNPQP
ncbi:hypothetical protein M1555_04380 [Patescibacteria group bacterium]|nr:hypothetical protein [Patescibacteria group bacterium]